jgi:hypothetical protein
MTQVRPYSSDIFRINKLYKGYQSARCFATGSSGSWNSYQARDRISTVEWSLLPHRIKGHRLGQREWSPHMFSTSSHVTLLVATRRRYLPAI